jgi:sugar lactone lactonase YvrE
MMRRSIVCAVVGALLCATPVFAQAPKLKATTPEIPYDSVPDFFKLPDGLYMGEGIAVATNSKGNVYVFTRSGKSRVFEFDRNGNFIKEFGKDSYAYAFAHAVRVDKDDNVWTVDEGTNVVLKYAPDGRLLMVLGKRPDPIEQLNMMPGTAPYSGANRPYSFHRPTDLGFDPQGNIMISDGYTDSRVVKYSPSGRFIKSAGKRGNGSGPLEFNTPHTIAVDGKGMVYVGDRGNARVVVLDNDLNQKAVYDGFGAPWGVCISTEGPQQYLYSSNSAPVTLDARTRENAGELYKLQLDGKVVGRFGGPGKALKQFASVHHLDCRNPNELYITEIQSWRVQKIILKPDARPSTN